MKAPRPEGCLSLHEVAAQLKQPTHGQHGLFELLKRKGIVDRVNHPAPLYIERGLFRISYGYWIHKTDGQIHYRRTYVTPAGVDFIGRLLAAEQAKSA